MAESRQSLGQTIVWILNNDNLYLQSTEEIIKSFHIYYFISTSEWVCVCVFATYGIVVNSLCS